MTEKKTLDITVLGNAPMHLPNITMKFSHPTQVL